MSYEYQRHAGFEANLYKGRQADENATECWLALSVLKASLDSMEEIPTDLMPLYREICEALDRAKKVKDSTHQVRMMIRKIANRR